MGRHNEWPRPGLDGLVAHTAEERQKIAVYCQSEREPGEGNEVSNGVYGSHGSFESPQGGEWWPVIELLGLLPPGRS